MAWGNRDYWKARRGDLYAEQQEIRRRSGQQAYECQESWLLSQLEALNKSGKVVRLLDFGVGFGRIARLLAGFPGVDYFGFDISKEMVAPLLLNPPEGLENTEARIYIGDRLRDVPLLQKFDVIFSISVLIHNTPEQARTVLADMVDALAPEGQIWLIENSPVLFSMLDNVWHDGCWVHDIAYTTAPELDVEIDIEAVPGHGVYRLRRPVKNCKRQVLWRESDSIAAIERDIYCARAISRTEQAVRGLESEIAELVPSAGAARDDAELYRRANVMSVEVLARLGECVAGELIENQAPVSRLIRRFDYVTEQLAQAEREKSLLAKDLESSKEVAQALEARLDTAERHIGHAEAALNRRQHLLRAVMTPHIERMENAGAADAIDRGRVQNTAMQFNDIRDTRFAHSMGEFEGVCHVMHQEWFGIRAAAGALPGQKIAISAARPPTASDIDRAAVWLGELNVKRVVVHGFSESMATLIKGLQVAGFPHISLVWHGAPVMWLHEPERRLFFLALSMARKGYLRRIQSMRGGADVVLGQWGWPKQLLNMPPHVKPRPRTNKGRQGAIAMAPSWNLLHKNLVTNVLGAIEAECVEQVWVLAEDFALPPDLHRKVKILPKLESQQMLDSMQLADVVLNVSLVDCHPMVELEALSVGTPAIRGRLWLDALEDHPYVRVTEVQDPLSIRAVAERISAVHALDRAELGSMMSDYASQLVAISALRYAEFLEL